MEYSPRILPWRDWDGACVGTHPLSPTKPTVDPAISPPHTHAPPVEWTETSRLLFAAAWAHRRLGVDRVQAWRARGRVPVAVDATAAVLEARAQTA